MKIVLIIALAALALGALAAEEVKTPAQIRVEKNQAACEKAARSVSVTHPVEATKAMADATQKCMAGKDQAEQRRQIALHKSALALCTDTADLQRERDSLSDASRDQVHAVCMKAHGYVQ